MSSIDPNLRVMHKDDFKALLAEAAETGAKQALATLGFDSPERLDDLRTALDIGRGVREAKREIWKQIGKAVFWLLIAGVAAWFMGFLGPKIGAKAAAFFAWRTTT